MQDPSIGWGLVTTTHERREGSRKDLVTFAIFSSDQLTARTMRLRSSQTRAGF